MLVAAYLVGGFLIASVYAVGHAARPARPLPPARFLIPFTVAAIATPIQMLVGDELARWVYNNEPVKFAAIELVPKTVERRARDAVRAPELERRGDGRLRDPRAGVDPLGSGRRARARWSRASTRSRERAADRSPRSTSCTSRGTSWSGSARCCSCSRAGTRCRGCSGATSRRASCSCGSPPAPVCFGRGARGRLGRHRGRPPAVDRPQLHEGRAGGDAATPGVWVTFLVIAGALHRRRRHAGADPADDEPALARAARGRRRRDVPVRPARSRSPVGRPAPSRSRSW